MATSERLRRGLEGSRPRRYFLRWLYFDLLRRRRLGKVDDSEDQGDVDMALEMHE
jgi:hypothetical protein